MRSSLLLALVLGGAAPQDSDPNSIPPRLRALATADEAGREEILKSFDRQPVNWVLAAPGLLGIQEVRERDAVRRWLPHPIWIFHRLGTVGAARQRERELLGPDPKSRPGDFVRAALALLEKDATAALRLLGNLRSPDPRPFLPFLSSDKPEIVRLAALAISQTEAKPPMVELMKLFRSPPEANGLAPAIVAHGTSDLSPELAAILAAEGADAGRTITVLEKIGDGRAESAVIGYLLACGPKAAFGALQTLSHIGGAASIDAIRKYAADLRGDDERRAWCRSALVRLRAPGTAAGIVADVRAGRVALDKVQRMLARLGDRSIAPDLALLAAEKQRKIEDRRAALELLGVLGDASQRKLLEQHLQDDRFEGAAAEGLSALGLAESAGPLAEALKGTGSATFEIGRAILSLPAPSAAIEGALLEILDDPDGHDKCIYGAVELAARAGSPKVRVKLLEQVSGERLTSYISERAMRTLIPSLTPADRDALLRARKPGGRRNAVTVTMALAALGDKDALKELADLLAERRYSPDPREKGNPIDLLPQGARDLEATIDAAFTRRNTWYDGAEWLFRQGHARGRPLVVETALGMHYLLSDRAAEAFLRKGDTSLMPAFLEKYSETPAAAPLCALLAQACTAQDVDRLRFLAWDRPFVGGHGAVRLLAQGDDRAMIPMYRRILRNHFIDNHLDEETNEGMAMLALASLKDSEARVDILRSLRSSVARRRSIAAKALAILDGRAAAAELAPLLDDLEEERRTEGDPYVPPPRVRDAVLEAIESLAGAPFKGSLAERVRAARDWGAKNRDR